MGLEYKDYYKILGVERNADKDAISRAYKKLARQYHPDLNPGNSSAEEKFKEVTEAYEVLKDAEKRKMYDQLGPDWQNAQQFRGGGPGFENMHFSFNGHNVDGAGFSDFFETLFGGARTDRGGGFGADPFGGFSARQHRGRDIEAEMVIPLEDAVKGGERSVTIQGGDGPRTLKVTIPPGVRDGARLRLAGQGHPSPSGVPDQNGDLYLKIRFAPHPRFHVEGNDLIHDLRLEPWEAVLGAKVRVPTLEGEVELNIPAGTASGRKLRLRGKGLGSSASRGDEYIRVGINAPTNLTAKQRELWEALAGEARK